MTYILCALTLWGIFHSLTASHSFKEKTEQLFGSLRFYRLGYNLFALASFFPVAYLTSALPDAPAYEVAAPFSYLMRGGQILAALLLFVAFAQTDMFSFTGMTSLFEKKEKPSKLVVNGLYRFMRHPLYVFGLLFIWLNPIVSQNSLALYVGATIYVFIGAYFEERKLLRKFGAEYATYRKTTWM
jgi:protein-S-isoprenylcysteine O-methyltransferase Ste14